MLSQYVTHLVLAQGAPQPPSLFGDASGMPGIQKLQTVVHWIGTVIMYLCVVAIGCFGAQLVYTHRHPEQHTAQHSKGAAMIMAGLTVLGSVSGIVTFFTRG